MRCHALAVLALQVAFNIFVFVDGGLGHAGPGTLVATVSLLVLGVFLAVQLVALFPKSWNRIKRGAQCAVAACGHCIGLTPVGIPNC